MRNNFYVLLMLLISVFSCKKEDSNNIVIPKNSGKPENYYDHHVNCFHCTIPIDSTDLFKCKYKTGSYWVYYDSVTNSIDSQYVIEFTQNLQLWNPYYFETHSFKVASSQSSTVDNYFLFSDGLFKVFNPGFKKHNPIYTRIDTINYYMNTVYHYPHALDSLYIYDKYYYNVQIKDIENDTIENNKRSIYYANSEYGILRHDIFFQGVLESKKVLMRNQIIR
jgi:hypothetical protein